MQGSRTYEVLGTSVAVADGAGGPGAALENYANNSSAQSLRERRYVRRGALWTLSDLERVRKCGRVPNGAVGAGVGLRIGPTGAGLAGLCTCGSVWSCPVCAAKIMMRRAIDIGTLLAAWHAQGGVLAFATFTMRHRKGQPLVRLWDGLQRAWGRVTSGRRWLADQTAYGIEGWVRVVEVTHGRNGWHVHVHAVFLLAGKATDVTVARMHSAMFDRWSAGLVAAGFAAPLRVAQDARLVRDGHVAELAAYFAKAVDLPGSEGGPVSGVRDARVRATGPRHGSTPDAGRALGLELTQTFTKDRRSALGTLPPWRLLDLVLEDGDAGALDLWHEWERGSKGRRQISYSVGIRDRLGVGAVKSDDDVAAEVVGDEDLVLITTDGWSQLVARPHLIAQLLDAADRGGLRAAREFLDVHRIDYVEV